MLSFQAMILTLDGILNGIQNGQKSDTVVRFLSHCSKTGPKAHSRNIKKSFSSSDINFILSGVDLDVKFGESVAIVGKSGSGKSTLLQICGLLDEPTEGSVIINGSQCSAISDDKKTLIRRNSIGFIYQFHHLLSEFLETALCVYLLLTTSLADFLRL